MVLKHVSILLKGGTDVLLSGTGIFVQVVGEGAGFCRQTCREEESWGADVAWLGFEGASEEV